MPYGSQGLLDLTNNRSLIVNGDSRISQDLTQTQNIAGLASATGTRIRVDRWRLRGTVAVGQNAFVQSLTGLHPLSGFQCLQIQSFNITDANNDGSLINQWVGNDARAFVGRTMIADFWIRSSTTGPRSFAIQCQNAASSYVIPFYIVAANTWQRISAPFAYTSAVQTSQYSGISFPVLIGANAAPGRTAASVNAWIAGNVPLAPGASPLISAAGETVQITDVQVIVGPALAPYETLTTNAELNRCRQWLAMSYEYNTNPGTLTLVSSERFAANVAGAAANSLPDVRYPFPMVAIPTLTLYNPEVANNEVRRLGAADCTASAAVNIGTRSFQVNCTGDAGAVIGSPLGFHWLADVGA